MKNFLKKRGSALVEYTLVAVFIGLAFAYIAFKMKPDFFKNYFIKSIDKDAVTGSSTFTIKTMGE